MLGLTNSDLDRSLLKIPKENINLQTFEKFSEQTDCSSKAFKVNDGNLDPQDIKDKK